MHPILNMIIFKRRFSNHARGQYGRHQSIANEENSQNSILNEDFFENFHFVSGWISNSVPSTPSELN